MAGAQTWQSADGQKNITISGVEAGIERIPSPVFFKIIDNNIYFIIQKIDDELYEKKFTFKGCGKSGTLPTPGRSDFDNSSFDTVAFMSEYVGYCNEKYKKKYNKKNNKKNNKKINVFRFMKGEITEEFSDGKGEQSCQNT